LAAWKAFFALGPASVFGAAQDMAEVMLTKPRELIVLIEAGHSLYAGSVGLVAVAVGFVLLRLAQPAPRAAAHGVPATASSEGVR
jgi:hypothetical protein